MNFLGTKSSPLQFDSCSHFNRDSDAFVWNIGNSYQSIWSFRESIHSVENGCMLIMGFIVVSSAGF
jgi:hypothetical protein